MRRKTAVIAFGGNALIRQNEKGTQEEQEKNAAEAAALIASVGQMGYQVLLVHGNGPQVGNILIQIEEASARIPPFTLDVSVAMSQGSMGYMLDLALRNEYGKRALDLDVVTVETQILVHADDPGMVEPTKPIGPFYPRYQAAVLQEEKAWSMVEDSGRGYRRVVPSPRPVEVLQATIVSRLLDAGVTVIAGGGGGIPVVRRPDGTLQGVEAVIDKDYTASLLAVALRAELFVILTFTARVSLDFGTSRQRDLDRVRLSEARRYLDEGQFPPGSMGPKMESMIAYVDAVGRPGLITSPDALAQGLSGVGGTWITP